MNIDLNKLIIPSILACFAWMWTVNERVGVIENELLNDNVMFERFEKAIQQRDERLLRIIDKQTEQIDQLQKIVAKLEERTSAK